MLWFEADLFDQLQLAQVLALRAPREAPERVTLICVGEYLGLALRASAATSGQLEARARGGGPYRRDAPLAGPRVRDTCAPPTRAASPPRCARTPELPFVPAAFDRLWARGPVDPQRPLAQRAAALADIAEARRGPRARRTFARTRREGRPILGGASTFATIKSLAAGSSPLVALGDGVGGAPQAMERSVALTDAGLSVLGGAARTACGLNGIDRWLGGVHLHGPEAAWRWDDGVEAVVASAGA